MIPPDITQTSVQEAMQQIKEEGIPQKYKSTKHCLVEGDKHFPPKYTIALAYEISTGSYLDVGEFSGGNEANNFLRKLGFEIHEECRCGGNIKKTSVLPPQLTTIFENYSKILEQKSQIIFYGPPGTGKTFTAIKFAEWFVNQNLNSKNKNTYVRNVTFHPSYSYEEFIEGLKPKLGDSNIEFYVENGIFKKICQDAKDDPYNKYVLIIDEINRGNTGKIFGELITLIENDKRGKASTALETHLTYSQECFIVPPNVYLLGTMNTADRSLSHLDSALRRRFGFVEMMPNYSIIDVEVGGVDIAKLLKNLNVKIRKYEGREKQIGHSYFMKNGKPINTIQDLQFTFAHEIIPLLQDYFYEDYGKLYEILGGKFIDKNDMKVRDDWKNDVVSFKEGMKKFDTDEQKSD